MLCEHDISTFTFWGWHNILFISKQNEDPDANRNTHPTPPEKDPRMLEYDGEDIPIQAPNRMMRHIAHEVDLMLQLADKMHEVCTHNLLLIIICAVTSVCI